MKFNTPNKLTIFRIVLIPFFMVFLLYNVFGGEKEVWCRIVSAAIFIAASVTDILRAKMVRSPISGNLWILWQINFSFSGQ